MLTIGVIGAGVWGKNHVRVFNELENVNLTGVSDLNENLLKRVSSVYKVRVTKNYNEILSDEKIDAVSICTPSSTHYKIAKDALNSGKHVLVEKPLALNSRDGEELIELANEKKRLLMVGHIFRFNPAVLRLREEISKGTFGKIRFMYGSRMGLMTPRNDCGVITDFALHDFDTFCFLLDKYPKEVTAVASSYNKSSFEDIGFCTLMFDENIIANVGVSWLTPKKVRDLWVIGEKCSASLDYLPQILEIHHKGMVPEYNSYGEFRLLTKQEGDDVRPFIPAKEPLKMEISHFVECLEKKKPLKFGPEIGNNIIKIIEAAYKSIEEKRTVEVGIGN
jgi:UDP-N-acetylglucosamine 3-dehydrogenase